MSRFNTGNPLGSGDPRDLDDNAKNMDLAVNSDELRWSDRFGRDRKSFEGMEREFESAQDSREARFNDFIAASGYQFLGDYAAGIEFTEYNQLVRDENGEFWRLSGQVELPYTTTGSGIPEGDALVPAGDAVLRQDLANPDKGAAMVARGVVAVDSIADLLALPEGMRREDLRYLVTSYHAGLVQGGGPFRFDPGSTDSPNGGTIFSAGGPGPGRFLRDKSPEELHVTDFGARPLTQCFVELDSYANFMTSRNLEINVTGGPYLFDQTLDLTGYTKCKFVGDAVDTNNTERYNLVYTGDGIAIDCGEIVHDKLGLAGTLSPTDQIRPATTAIRASHSTVHRGSCLRNFGTIYKRTGGFYHKVEGGRLSRANLIYDSSEVPLYNATFNAQHTDFSVGILAAGGNGPVIIGGSWERWTTAIVDTNTSSQFGIDMQGIYVENYPDTPVASGVVSENGFYSAPTAFRVGAGSIKGTGTIFIDGITGSVFEGVNPRLIDVAIDWYDGGSADRPNFLFEGESCRVMDIKSSYRQGDFSGVAVVSPALKNSLVASGSYLDFDLKTKTPFNFRANELRNGWAMATGSGVELRRGGGGVVQVKASLNGTAATDQNCFNLLPIFRPESRIGFQARASTRAIVYGVIYPNGDILLSNLNGTIPTDASVEFSVTYLL